jgi:hypothetical protein
MHITLGRTRLRRQRKTSRLRLSRSREGLEDTEGNTLGLFQPPVPSRA